MPRLDMNVQEQHCLLIFTVNDIVSKSFQNGSLTLKEEELCFYRQCPTAQQKVHYVTVTGCGWELTRTCISLESHQHHSPTLSYTYTYILYL